MIRYKTVLGPGIAEQIIEKSRFIAHVTPAGSKEEADAFIASVRIKYKDATHNVPAMVIGDKFQIQWASDDGEPQGTSGAPMVQMLVKEGITDIAVVITRYFGGIKLGTGGLVRAYTGSAKLGIEAAGICVVKEMYRLSTRLDYTYLAKLQNLAHGEGFEVSDLIYTDQITATLVTEPENAEHLHKLLANLTGGTAKLLNRQTCAVKAPL